MCPSWLCDFDRTSGPEADVMSLSCLVLLKNGGDGVWLSGEKEAETPHGEGAGEPGV